MGEVRGSKNEISNRGKKTVRICNTCGEVTKPVKLYKRGKARMVFECKCGYLNRQGDRVL